MKYIDTTDTAKCECLGNDTIYFPQYELISRVSYTLAWIWLNIFGCVICSYMLTLGKYQLIHVQRAVEPAPNQWQTRHSTSLQIWTIKVVVQSLIAGSPCSTVLKTCGLLPKRFIHLTAIEEIYWMLNFSAWEDLGSSQGCRASTGDCAALAQLDRLCSAAPLCCSAQKTAHSELGTLSQFPEYFL